MRARNAALGMALALLAALGAGGAEAPVPAQFTGAPLTLDFQDIETRAALQLIADFSDRNLVASDAVSGSVTLRLERVPWDQALDLILRTQGLDKREIGNVLLVAPAAEIAARERLELENRRQFSELAPLARSFSGSATRAPPNCSSCSAERRAQPGCRTAAASSWTNAPTP